METCVTNQQSTQVGCVAYVCLYCFKPLRFGGCLLLPHNLVYSDCLSVIVSHQSWSQNHDYQEHTLRSSRKRRSVRRTERNPTAHLEHFRCPCGNWGVSQQPLLPVHSLKLLELLPQLRLHTWMLSSCSSWHTCFSSCFITLPSSRDFIISQFGSHLHLSESFPVSLGRSSLVKEFDWPGSGQ